VEQPHDEPAPAPPSQSTAPSSLARRVLEMLEDDGLRARSVSGLAENLERSPAEINAALDELIAIGSAIRAGRDLAFAADAVAQAEAAIVELGSDAGGFSLADARDRLGVGRKHTQALLELLDGRRVTLRRANKRVLRRARETPCPHPPRRQRVMRSAAAISPPEQRMYVVVATSPPKPQARADPIRVATRSAAATERPTDRKLNVVPRATTGWGSSSALRRKSRVKSISATTKGAIAPVVNRSASQMAGEPWK